MNFFKSKNKKVLPSGLGPSLHAISEVLQLRELSLCRHKNTILKNNNLMKNIVSDKNCIYDN